MHRVVREPRRPGVLPMVPAAITAALAILMAAPLHAVQTPTPLPSAEMGAAQAPWPWMAVALLSALAGALLALWLERRHQRVKAELRETRDQAQRLAELSEHWQWQTDLGHRLVLLQTPSGASALPAKPSRPALWEHLPAQGDINLRTLLEGHGPLHDIVVTLPAGSDGTPGGPALLRGSLRNDERGAPVGHAGTLKPIAAAPAVPMAAALAVPNDAPDADEQASFSYTVSHDLRAPIRVVEGFTRILKEDYGRLLDRIGNDHLDRVLGAAARMNSMIDALLALSRLSSQPLSRQPVNLSQLAAYVAEDLRRQVPGRDVLLHIEPGLQVQGDPTLLRLVLENLLGNAWKYTGKTRAPEVWFERMGSAEHTYIVRDNGAGFDMRFCDRLFGVFQRLHSASDFQGTGVGLASVRRIVRRHGGEVWAEAEVDRGASFYFSLPQA